jgi:hypothetical protein
MTQRRSRLLLTLVVGSLVATACGSTVQTTSQLQVSGGQGTGLDGTGTDRGLPAGPGSTAGPQAVGPLSPQAAASTPVQSVGPVKAGSQVPTTFNAIPVTGPGWDAKTITIGIPTEEDIGAAAGALGFNFQPGSINGDVKAILADINAKGGLFGRKLVALFRDNSTTSIQSNAEVVAAENCAYFTQDHKVVAVLTAVTPLDTDAYRACLKKANTPMMALEYQLYDDETFRIGGTRLVHAAMYNLSRFGPSFISTLKAVGYFGGWDAATGAANAKPPVVGLLQTDSTISHRLVSNMQKRLNALGIKNTAYFYPDTALPDMSNAVLQFRTAGVSHMITIPPAASATLQFATTANRQNYRPRYAMSSYLLPMTLVSLFQTAGVSRQLNGSIGIGWTPKADVDGAHDLPDNATQKVCRTALAKGGQTFSGDNERFAYFVGLELCDALHLIHDSLARAGNLGPDALVRGLVGLGPTYPLGATHSNGLAPDNHAVPGKVRDLFYDPSCSCFVYRGAAHSLSG